MISLPCPQTDVVAYITKVVAERQNGRNRAYFTAIEQDWIARCEEYVAAGGTPAVVTIWDQADAQSGSFGTLYSSPKGGVQAAEIKALRDRRLQLCPMCGEAGTPNTLDHYLPFSIFPHFSILPANLVPACDACQSKKLTDYDGPNGRLFLHPYFDTFAVGQILRLRFEQPYDLPIVYVESHPDLDPAHVPLVMRHVASMHLEARLRLYFDAEWLRLLKLSSRARDRGRNVRSVIEDFKDNALNRSVNSWEHLLYESVLNDDDVMLHLTAGQMPAQI